MNIRTSLRLLAVAVMAVAGGARVLAQNDTGTTGETTTHYTDVSRLPGVEVSDNADIYTDGTRPGNPTVENPVPNSEQRKKMFFLYNISTGKVLYSGGQYGTTAVLNPVGHYLWLEKVPTESVSSKNGPIRIHCSLTTQNEAGNAYGYFRMDGNNFYMDHQVTQDHTGWNFQKVTSSEYNNENVYLIYSNMSDGSRRYIVANNKNTEGAAVGIGYYTRSGDQLTGLENGTSTSPIGKEGYWKVISLEEYATLFNTTAAEMSAPLNATFLILDPGFHVNNQYVAGWKGVPDDATNQFRFGTEEWYKTYLNRATNSYVNYDANIGVQNDYGKYYYAYTHTSDAQTLYQDIEVYRAGWYTVLVNGFSTLNYVSEGVNKNVATLFAQVGTNESTRSSQALNGISSSTVSELMAPPSGRSNWFQGVNIGKAFYDGQYSNQVMVHVSESDLKDGKATVRIGINIANTNSNTSAAKRYASPSTPTITPTTAFDSFELLYSNTGNLPDLILDEEDEGLDILKNTTDVYDNSTLHLNRSFTLGKWNTIVLPVSLNATQLKEAFGDDLQLAYLKNLTSSSMQFERVDLNNNGLVAYQPYIIKPSKDPGTTPSYTTPTLKSDNDAYKVTKTIAANHYLITRVSFDRTALSNADDNWKITWSGNGSSASESNNTVTAFGTVGKTYTTTTTDGKTTGAIITGRDNLAGDYYMSKGEMYRVPADKVYGLKAFRVWFENATTSQAKLTAYVDNDELEVHDNGTTTGIDGITFTQPNGVYSADDAEKQGVYTITGQRVRENASTVGLPSGLYVVAGKKVMVK